MQRKGLRSFADDRFNARLAMPSMNPNRIRKSPALIQSLDGIHSGMLDSDVEAYRGMVEGVGYHESSPQLYQIALAGVCRSRAASGFIGGLCFH